MVDPYNPLEKLNLGKSVADALLASPVASLADTANLMGAGIYAIYYLGAYRIYGPIKALNVDERFECPIYVGKAIPKGGRKGGLGRSANVSRALRDRLAQHAKSIDECSNLKLEDFYYRALVVDDIWIPLGENVLIEMFTPLWNRVIDGFGNKDPGNRRKEQYKSPWDVLHPGRLFAEKLGDSGQTAKALSAKVKDYLAGKQVTLVEEVDTDASNGDVTDDE